MFRNTAKGIRGYRFINVCKRIKLHRQLSDPHILNYANKNFVKNKTDL
jgi:hypothetical protein